MFVRRIVVGFVAAVSLVVGCQSAFAGIRTYFNPGMTCQTYGKPSAIRVGSGGSIVNSSTTTRMEVLCPLATHIDDDLGAVEMSISYPMVSANSSEVSCTIYARREHGERIAAANLDSVSSNGTGKWRYRLSVSRNFTLGYGLGYFYLDCTLPPQGALFGYAFLQHE